MEDFNSHTREGVTSQVALNVYKEDFNSHTREGVTYGGYSKGKGGKFQLTHP